MSVKTRRKPSPEGPKYHRLTLEDRMRGRASPRRFAVPLRGRLSPPSRTDASLKRRQGAQAPRLLSSAP